MSNAVPLNAGLIRDFLREALPADRMAAIERAARTDPAIMAMIIAERESLNRGDHSLGAIWQEHQISCPSREQLGGYLISAGEPDFHEYILFHLTVIECAVCQANLDDLRQQTETKKSNPAKPKRRR
jgi:hypothetical protein